MNSLKRLKMLKTATLLIATTLLALNSALATECQAIKLTDSKISYQLQLKTDTEYCLDLHNSTDKNIAIISNMPGSKIVTSTYNREVKSAIIGNSYYVFNNNSEVQIWANSTFSKIIKINITTEDQAEKIVFRNHAINFLLLGIIFSVIAFNLIYATVKNSKAALWLSLLTTSSICYFAFEAILNQLSLDETTATFYIKLISFISGICGLALLHNIITSNHKISSVLSIGIAIFLSIGLQPSIPLDYYRLFFVVVIIHVFINILTNCKKQKNLIWYLIGSSIPSLFSISLVLINEILPTISSYNLILLAISLQSIFISRTILLQNNPYLAPQAQDTPFGTDNFQQYLSFCKNAITPEIAQITQLIKHYRPQLGSETCRKSIFLLQLSELLIDNKDSRDLSTKLASAMKNYPQLLSHNLLENTEHFYFHSSPTVSKTIESIANEYNTSHKEQLLKFTELRNGNGFLSIFSPDTENKQPIQPTHNSNYWLIIDDNSNLVDMMIAQCASIAQKTHKAQSPASAIDCYLKHLSNIERILIDWNLDNETAMKTIQTINELIAEHKLPAVAIHIMSAQKIDKPQISKLTSVEILEKPITIERLKSIKNNN